jgi:hypothetical protein
MRKIYLCFFVGIFVASIAKSQFSSPSILNIAGGFSKIGALDSEWSLGELCMIETYNMPGFIFTQGVLQPCTDMVTKWPPTVSFLLNEYKLFPNPTRGKFELNFFLKICGRMILQLVDASGKLITSRDFRYECCGSIETFDNSGLPNGVYMLHARLIPDDTGGGASFSIRNSAFPVLKID